MSVEHFGSPMVCIKQCIYRNPGSTASLPYESRKQAEQLTSEIACLGWGTALIEEVYNFIEVEEAKRGKPPFDIPRMRFVQAALAIAKTDAKETFLIEEVIDEKKEGKFVKYLNNDSPKPIKLKNPERIMRAEFLSFAQHAQYMKTGGMAFISDFQGVYTKLTLSSSLLYRL